MKTVTALLLCLAAPIALAAEGPAVPATPTQAPDPAKQAAPEIPKETPAPDAAPQEMPTATVPPEADASQNSLSSIAAVVNDDVVSSLDLENRMHMVLATTHLDDTPETREHLRPQILRALIDEKLQMQEAAKNNIDIKQQDLDNAVKTIEQQRNMQPGELLQTLDSLGVPRSTFYDQIRAQLAWTKLIVKTVKPKVRVSDDEVERERNHVQQENGASEFQVEVLGLPVDRPENDTQVRQLAEKLADGVRGGASFESVARELGGSGAAGAQDMAPFWVAVDQMDPGLAKALEHTKPGGMVGPVRTLEGYTLAKLVDVRRAAVPVSTNVTEVVYKDIVLKRKAGASKPDDDELLAVGKQVAEQPGTCAQPGVAATKNLEGYDVTAAFKSDTLEGLPGTLKESIGRLSVGGVSDPVASDGGVQMFMLCERVEKPAGLADRERTTQHLYQQKLELEAAKYLRNLRRDATIDIRG